MNIPRIKEWTEAFAPWAGIVALLAGAAFGIVQYQDKKAQDRVQATFAFFDRYNTGTVFAARTEVLAIWQKHLKRQYRILGDESLPADAFNVFAERVIRDEKMMSRISQIHEFFSALEICVRREICDRKVAIPLFQADAVFFWNQHYGYVMAERKIREDPHFGRGLHAFTRMSENVPDPTLMFLSRTATAQ